MNNSITVKEVHIQTTNSTYKFDMVRTYLHEIGRIPLLNYEQEIYLSKQVQQMLSILTVQEKLALELKREPTLQEWANSINMDEKQLLDLLNQGQEAKQKMLVANLRLVVSIAKKYQRRNLDFLDLIQEGTLGLERGIEKFDPTKGYKFSTYAYWWIRQAITRAIAQQGRTIRLPIHITERLNKIKSTQRELSQKLGRIPTTIEIARVLDLQPHEIRQYWLSARQPVSLEMRVGSELDTELQDMLEDDGLSPENYTIQQSLTEDIQNLLSKLPPQQQKILTLRFGLTDGKEFSLAEIGEQIGISRERVRQLEQQALNTLRRHKNKVSSYLAS
ncbi:RNA polymerase sigma factor, RpoD/SigA family [Fischerella muscicola CCMEE 5323]|uniref:RNA polymerase sigma factor n=1 Tax=Fischerella muscicola CCMEE 5323 TaxID=2019572 RepID=A0A2N6K7F2_FISMU|nr:RNA polymerase sigma factor, RpoD/SigA family [Fischerella muscicola]PLZ92942.1 RNA polymerase sigma factor, RpoD/SigA family [Fischerella muscicola CCMEE 5323]